MPPPQSIPAPAAPSPIVSHRGRAIAPAAELRFSAQTFYSWKCLNAIPRYRRRAVHDAVDRMRLQLPIETIAYRSKVF